jgi:translocation and assembly module TamA
VAAPVSASLLRPFLTFLCCLAAAASSGAWGQELRYVAEIRVVGDAGGLPGQLRAVSQLVTLQDRPPATPAALRRRAEDDLGRLRPVLEANGYWAATLSFGIDTAVEPARVTVSVEPGPLYRFQSVTFRTPEGGTPPLLDRYDPSAFGLKLGDAARTAPVLDAEAALIAEYARQGRPYAKVPDRKVVVDHGTRTMDVTYTVDAGPQVTFGEPAIQGLSRLDATWVERRITWRRGDLYDSREVDATRRALVDSGLFTAVRITPAAELTPDGSVPVTLALVERLPRSIGAGLAYDTTLGFGARAFWENRNLFGGGERLRVIGTFAQNQLGLSTRFRKPDLWRKDEDLLAEADLADESPPAYTARRLRLYSGLERQFGPLVSGGAGLQFEQTNVESPPGTQTYSLIGAPIYLRRDSTNDLLNPTTGTRAALTVTPYEGLSSTGLAFMSNRVAASAYRSLGATDAYVLAGFGALGSIIGESRDALPADKRLYAGGGGSVRGYGYQLAGPFYPGTTTPRGGKSSLEAGVELRIKVTESIGVVPFLEAGNVYSSTLPTGNLLYGTGIGLRYYTPVGPVRLDVGVPLNKRASDSAFQIYISLGQAF